MYVLDATPLIYLATVERLELLGSLPTPSIVPESVYEEVVVDGLEAGHPDARRVERAVECDLVSVVSGPQTDLFERLVTNDRLSQADAAVLPVAADCDGTAVIDDGYGRDVAAVEGIDTRGTAYIVVWHVGEGILTPTEARETIDAMLEAGWYCSPDVYATIVQRIEDLP